MNSDQKDRIIIHKMVKSLEKIIKGGMTVKEYARLVKIILEFIKIEAISIRYVSMLFRIIGEEVIMDNYSEEIWAIQTEFEELWGGLEIPTTTIEEFIKKIEDLLKKIE